ncbi:single-strand binding family protein [Burkholderia ambifaria AMMD]|nr:single-stranded DNA-binding protein [Burkholderia ambifaria]AJY20598.1 single-strand binding family protein [Burkholderia ambifaria AMMD]MBR7932708.1 single-stranded DNA-binding protein [Burkholderia ambifaria]PEH67306.1 single-stranded DNA-binding protein [Burkholderia ambifaria]QQC05888.1 single-stranded DNA-binding protein [Burkholderia ambifaria]UZU06784.1 single-stranded DNA-binding protein [Burkholderia ambifaria]
MIDGLVSGRLYGEAQIGTGQNGKRFVTCKVRATAGDGETMFVNVIAFNDEVQTALLALGDTDSVSLSGALTPKVWADKNGVVKPALDMVAHGLLTAYHVQRKRKAVHPPTSDGHAAAGTDDDL